MKNILLFIISIPFLGMSQQFCHTDEIHTRTYANYPLYNTAITNSYNKLEQETFEFNSSNRASATYVIPVVFHVIHQNGIGNISEEQIKDQIRILNRDYGTLDSTIITDSFKTIVANCEIEFRLATLDPNGNCTNGITRHVNSLTTTGDHAVKSIVHWPPNQYLNFYVVNNAAGLAGHALLPYAADSLPQWDGIVMSHNSIGSIGTSNVQRSVVGSHEVGHYLNLQHVWGGNNVPNFPYLPVSSSGNCNYDDGVGDTPNTIGNQSCILTASSCGSLDNVQNFMDYSYCGSMFTIGQKNRMHAALNSTVANRNNLWSQANLIATGVESPSGDLCSVNFDSDKVILCEGDSVTFWDKSYHKVTNRSWIFEGGVSTSLNDSIVKVYYSTPGQYKVKLVVGNGLLTDSLEKELYIKVNSSTGNPSFVSEKFESTFIIPNSKWIEGVVDSNHWEIDNSIGFNSQQSFKYNNYKNDGKVKLTSATIDATISPSMSIQFTSAYAQKEINSTDKLKIFYSKDCGETWVLNKTYSSFALLTNFSNDTSPFIPSGSGEWKTFTTPINSVFLVPDFLVKFEFEGTSKGNNFYIDNINIGDPASISVEENWINKIKAYPNPTRELLKINNLPNKGELKLLDVSGKTTAIFPFNGIEKTISLQDIKKGVYFLKVKSNNIETYIKVIKK